MDIITKEQDIMIDMILQGETISDIAKSIGCTRQSIYNWKDKAHIKAEIEARRQDLKKTAHNVIVKDVCTYVENIKELANKSTDQRVRLQANKYLIDQCLGSPTAAKEDLNLVKDDDSGKDANTLKKELEDIKLQVVK